MYAIIKVGGNQYKVMVGDLLDVDLLPDKIDKSIQFPAMLVVDDSKTWLAKEAEKIMVTAIIVKHFKGEKIDIHRFRHKVRHRRHVGFRAGLTQIRIDSIGGATVRKVKSVVKTTAKAKKAKIATSRKK